MAGVLPVCSPSRIQRTLRGFGSPPKKCGHGRHFVRELTWGIFWAVNRS